MTKNTKKVGNSAEFVRYLKGAEENPSSESEFDDSDSDPDFKAENQSESSSSDQNSEPDESDIDKVKEDENILSDNYDLIESDSDRARDSVDIERQSILETLKKSRPKSFLEKSDPSELKGKIAAKRKEKLYKSRKVVGVKDTQVPVQRDPENLAHKKSTQRPQLVALERSPPHIEVPPLVQTQGSPQRKLVYNCKKCSKTFINLKSYHKHEENCGLSIYVCNLCQTKFKSVRYLKKHVKIVHKEPTILCEACEMRFHTLAKLKSHMKKHKSFPCVTCGKSFKNNGSLLTHKYKRHTMKNPTNKSWSCTFCPKILKSERGMRYHQALHKNIVNGKHQETGVESEEVEGNYNADPVPDEKSEHVDPVLFDTDLDVVEVEEADIEVDSVTDNIVHLI